MTVLPSILFLAWAGRNRTPATNYPIHWMFRPDGTVKQMVLVWTTPTEAALGVPWPQKAIFHIIIPPTQFAGPAKVGEMCVREHGLIYLNHSPFLAKKAMKGHR